MQVKFLEIRSEVLIVNHRVWGRDGELESQSDITVQIAAMEKVELCKLMKTEVNSNLPFRIVGRTCWQQS
jgi:hypothetical protein